MVSPFVARLNYFFYVDLTQILKESRDERELRHLWVEWHDKSGNPIRQSYIRFVELANEVARLNGIMTN